MVYCVCVLLQNSTVVIYAGMKSLAVLMILLLLGVHGNNEEGSTQDEGGDEVDKDVGESCTTY